MYPKTLFYVLRPLYYRLSACSKAPAKAPTPNRGLLQNLRLPRVLELQYLFVFHLPLGGT